MLDRAYYIQLLDVLRNNAQDKNTYAQANAKHILMSVDTNPSEYPRFNAKLADQSDAQIFLYFEIAVNLFYTDRIDSEYAFEHGAQLIEYNHTDQINKVYTSNYNLLLGALGYYCARQYSKAYILLKKVKQSTELAGLIKCFLTKNFNELRLSLGRVLLVNRKGVETIEESVKIIFSESLSMLLHYTETGDKEVLPQVAKGFSSIMRLAIIENTPDIWWIARLMMMVSKTIEENSLWKCLGVLDTNNTLTSKYIRTLVYRPKLPIIELFPSQKAALDKVLSNSGAVVCLPTSSGKTRIAEICILQTLIKESNAKILYIAPFRSLAYEIEESLSEVFQHLKINVTHLYGGSIYTKFDEELIKEAQLMIATPEKAKAILRGNKDVFESIKLVILDEGHLIGLDDRYIANEMFTEELRRSMQSNGGRFVLLSAVLPNPGDIAEWIAEDKTRFVTNTWRSSSQRLGLMIYEGTSVNIEWDSDPQGFNRHFVDNAFSKYDATAKTAKKLSKLGSVMIFIAQARCVISQGRAISSIENELVDWDNCHEWQHFSMACKESSFTELFELAKKGIICHSNLLPSNVRLAMESLLRLGKAKYIIATTTLAQGVNIGVSVVIFHSVDRSYNKPIPSRDFWNIAGRAGRAFVDSEGIILYLLDKTVSQWSFNNQVEQAKKYLNASKMEDVHSGVGLLFQKIFTIAMNVGINFDELLEMLANNNVDGLVDSVDKSRLNSMDDSLLSLIGDIDDENVEETLKHMLAYIQEKSDISRGRVLQMLKARVRAVKSMSQGTEWEKATALGIPLNDAIFLERNIGNFQQLAFKYILSGETVDDLLNLVISFETLLKNLPSGKFVYDKMNEVDFTDVQNKWFRGESTVGYRNGLKYVNEYISFVLPWAMNAVSRELSTQGCKTESDVYINAAACCEFGLPNISAVKIFKSGILSRSSAKIISEIVGDELKEMTISAIASLIEEQRDLLMANEKTDELTKEWVDYFCAQRADSKDRLPSLPKFDYMVEWQSHPDIVYCNRVDDKIYFRSIDYRWMKEIIPSSELPFDQVADVPGVSFRYKGSKEWEMINSNVWYKVR